MKNKGITIEMLDVLDQDYPRKPVNRVDAERFVSRQRGSVRLIMGRYRTEDEQEEFVTSWLKKPLPYPDAPSK